MKLSEWLKRNDVTRTAFAARIGVSPATITSLCNDGWMSRETAEAVMRETRGAVTPNDFMPVPRPTPSSEATA